MAIDTHNRIDTHNKNAFWWVVWSLVAIAALIAAYAAYVGDDYATYENRAESGATSNAPGTTINNQ